MITYMTRKSMFRTAADLDTIELGATLKHTMLVLDELTGISEEHQNHPILKAWKGYEFALCIYGMVLSMEWHTQRGYADKSFFQFKRVCDELREEAIEYEEPWMFVPPPWFEDTDVLQAFRSNLVRRWPDRYGDTWAKVPPNMPYLWPIVDDEGGYTLRLSKEDKKHLKAGERKLPKAMKEKIANA